MEENIYRATFVGHTRHCKNSAGVQTEDRQSKLKPNNAANYDKFDKGYQLYQKCLTHQCLKPY